LTAFVVGVLAAWLARNGETSALRRSLGDTARAASESQTELRSQTAAAAALSSQLEAERRSSADKLALLDAAQAKLSDAFEALSAKALQHNNQSFLDLATSALGTFQESARGDLERRQQAIAQTLDPVRESLNKFDSKMQDMERLRVDAYATLVQQVRSLQETESALRVETSSLVRALRSPVVRGRWGEIQLKRVVEMAGMEGHCDFFEQPTATTEDGRVRPDMRIRLPGGKNVIIDSKTPLESYLSSVEATDETARRNFLKQHAQNIRTHMNALARKSYWQDFGESPEFVVLFLPGEMFFSAALESDPTLIEAGATQNVIPATPTTLIALLRAVYYGWQQQAVALEAKAVSELGRELYKRLADMSDHFFKVGKSLGSAVEFYNRAIGSLESRVLVTARKFKDMQSLNVGTDIEPGSPIEISARTLQAPELTSVRDGLFPLAPAPAEAETDHAPEDNGTLSERNRSAMTDFSAPTPAPVFADTVTPGESTST